MKKNNKTDRDDTLDTLQEAFNKKVPEELEKKLGRMLNGFQQDLREHPYFSNQPWRRYLRWPGIFPFTLPLIRFLMLTGTGVACLVFIFIFLYGNKSPTWADVEEQFRAIPFCTVSVYYGGKYTCGRGKVQYWVSSNGRVRVHSGDKVSFMDLNKDRCFRTFDVKYRRESLSWPAWESTLSAFDKVERYGGLTFSSIIESMTDENIIDSTSLVISNAKVSNDLLIFDAKSFDTLWNIRVWALRESKLPIRILKWHRRYERYEEVLFSYSNEQPKEFFDPDAFAAKLKDPAYTEHQLKYMFLQDSGGQPFSTPGS